jgi:pyrimidine-nucleoside phosphorylase
VAIVGPTRSIAPADKKMYALRDVTGTVPSLPLIVASIMSKKLASGGDALVLDVKYGTGAFMVKRDAAIELARAMIAAGNAAGKKTVALLTRMEQPLGRAVGNWLEMAQTYAVLNGGGLRRGVGSGGERGLNGGQVDDLVEVTLALAAQMLVLAGVADTVRVGWAMANEKLQDGSALNKFREMILAQGGDMSIFEVEDVRGLSPEYRRRRECAREREVLAPRAGCVGSINALEVGLISSWLGAGREKVEDSVDYCAGIVFRRKVGEAVEKGDPIAVFYSEHSASVLDTAEKRLFGAVTVVDCGGGSGGTEGEGRFFRLPPVVDSFINERGELRPWDEYFTGGPS